MTMGGRIRDLLGAERPIFGFGMKLDVAIAASRAGGVGIWGCTPQTPDEIEAGVSRMEAELGGLPWGVDLVIPAGMPERDDRGAIEALLPDEHVDGAIQAGRLDVPPRRSSRPRPTRST